MKFLLVFAMFFCGVVGAQEFSHMLSGESYSSLEIADSRSGTGVDTSFSIGLGYDYYLGYGFQIGTDLGIAITNDTDVYSLLPGVTYNIFSDDKKSLASAFFFKINAGVVVVDYERIVYLASSGYSTGRESEFVYTVELGKRFAIANNVSWVPSIKMFHVPDAADSDPSFDINFLRLSVLF